MKICYLDAFSGISGDMTVGALLDAGADFAALRQGLETLNTGAQFRLEQVKRGGISGVKFHVDAPEQHGHRHLPHILQMIEKSALPGRARQNAIKVFQKLGEAEARVHGVAIEKVHFHEVGAVDSICDIAGACLCLHLLGIERVQCSAVNVGSGTVKTEHGLLPVPAPATAALLEGKPVYARGPALELTTPTGAAIVATLAEAFGPMPPLRISKIGYGAGDREFAEHANLLRAMIGRTSSATEAVTVSVIEANVDDATPQVVAYAMERLFSAGALDVTLSSIMMKKGRPGTLLCVMARPEEQEKFANIIFQETPTLGLRIYSAERRVEARRIEQVETPHGVVRVKVSGSGSFTPEYEDCRKLALETGVPLKEILAVTNFCYLNRNR